MSPGRFRRLEPWERNQYVMTAVVFVVFTGFAFVLPFLPLFVRELGVSPGEEALWAGALIGVSPLLAGLLAPVWGRLADRYGQKRIALRALVSYVALLALSALVRDVYQLLACRVGIGLAGSIGPLGLAMATSLAPREQTGRAVGLIQAAQILAAAVGPLAGGYLADHIGVRRTFLVTSVLCSLAVLLVVFYYEEGPRAAPGVPSPEGRLSFSGVLSQRGVPGLLVVLFLVNFVGRSFTPILPLHLERLGVAAPRLASGTGVLISVYSVAAALSATVLGRASRRVEPRLLLAASLLCGALAVAPMAAVPSFEAFLGLAVVLGLASGGALTLCYTIGGLTVPADVKTTAFGFFSGAALFGGALSPSVAGLIARWQFFGIYWTDAALFAVLAVVVFLWRRPGAESGPGAARASL